MLMEIAQLYKSTHNNQLQQSIRDLFHKRNVSQLWHVHTLCRAKVKGHTMMHTYTRPKVKSISHHEVAHLHP